MQIDYCRAIEAHEAGRAARTGQPLNWRRGCARMDWAQGFSAGCRNALGAHTATVALSVAAGAGDHGSGTAFEAPVCSGAAVALIPEVLHLELRASRPGVGTFVVPDAISFQGSGGYERQDDDQALRPTPGR